MKFDLPKYGPPPYEPEPMLPLIGYLGIGALILIPILIIGAASEIGVWLFARLF
jgi:hypothetical protein